MQQRFAIFSITVLLIANWILPVGAQSQTTPSSGNTPNIPTACEDGTASSGALYRICMPGTWNNKLVIYAHGYVAPNEPLAIPQLSAGGFSIDQILNFQGFAFATTSYRVNGLAVQQGINDLVDLVNLFKQQKGTPQKVILLGVSEGGVISVLAMEKQAALFDAALAVCGPYGSFAQQVNYFGDFRALFDYFFPGLIAGDATNIPADVMTNWQTSLYSTTVLPALINPANSSKVQQLLKVSGAAIDPSDPITSSIQTISQILWYNVFATNDAASKLGGQPYDNTNRLYSGSADDVALNKGVKRYKADSSALTALLDYESSGKLTKPVVTMHTTLDPIVPVWHNLLYRAKTIAADNIALHQAQDVNRYGHCNFDANNELLPAFNQAVALADSPPAYVPVKRGYLPVVSR